MQDRGQLRALFQRLVAQGPQRSPIRSVGVLVVSHRQEYLEECLRSILTQTTPAARVVLIDNGSPEEAPASAVASRLGIDAVRSSRPVPLATARNLGCAYLDDCDALASVDGDDLLEPRFLEVYSREADAHGADVVFGAAKLFGSRTGTAFTAAERGPRPDLRRGNHIPANALFRRDLWSRTSGFDPQLEYFEDWDFWLSCAEQGAVFRPVESPLWRYRQHAASMLGSSSGEARDRARRYVRDKHVAYIRGPLQWRRWLRGLQKRLPSAQRGRTGR